MITDLKRIRSNYVTMCSLWCTFCLHKKSSVVRQFEDVYEYKSNSLASYNNEQLSKLNNLPITQFVFAPFSFGFPACHYFLYVCPQCIIEFENFLDLLSAVLTSDQPALQTAIIWKLCSMMLQISWWETLWSEIFILYPEVMLVASLHVASSGNEWSIIGCGNIVKLLFEYLMVFILICR